MRVVFISLVSMCLTSMIIPVTGFGITELYPSLSLDSPSKDYLHHSSLEHIEILKQGVQKGEFEMYEFVNGVYKLRTTMNDEVNSSHWKIEQIVFGIKEKIDLYKRIMSEYMYAIKSMSRSSKSSTQI